MALEDARVLWSRFERVHSSLRANPLCRAQGKKADMGTDVEDGHPRSDPVDESAVDIWLVGLLVGAAVPSGELVGQPELVSIDTGRHALPLEDLLERPLAERLDLAPEPFLAHKERGIADPRAHAMQ